MSERERDGSPVDKEHEQLSGLKRALELCAQCRAYHEMAAFPVSATFEFAVEVRIRAEIERIERCARSAGTRIPAETFWQAWSRIAPAFYVGGKVPPKGWMVDLAREVFEAGTKATHSARTESTPELPDDVMSALGDIVNYSHKPDFVRVAATELLQKYAAPLAHNLYATGDSDAPESIKDRNGAVVLGLCRRCGRGEAELVERCEYVPNSPSDSRGVK